MLISKSTIQDVNSRLDAVSIVGEYIRLEQKSGRWWGRCPFHGGGQEKTPSFTVDPDKKMFYCFGCNKGGSVIGFLMEMEKLTYPEVIKRIAVKAGIEIVYEEGSLADNQDSCEKDELFDLYRRLTATFQHFLTENNDTALNYLRERGISDEMIAGFKLGFSPSDRNFLFSFLRQKGYSDDFLAKSGLFSSKYKTMPLFSGRLMFPIEDRQGRIVAFGGRAMPGTDMNETPKYINSPETEIYKKGQMLFAIDKAKPLMRQTKTVFLVEGYMDVIALHQAGITNSVAPLGTSFTDDQALWLRRWSEKVILIFDNDEAGQKAAYKAILTCRKNSLSCAVADIKTGLLDEANTKNYEKFKDPADILKEFGSGILKNVLKFTINDFEYLISRGRSQYVAADGNIKSAAEYMYPYLETLDSDIGRSDSITRIADIFKIERSAVYNDYSKWKQNSFQSAYKKPQDSQTAQQKQCVDLAIRANSELNLLLNVALNMELYPEFRSALEIKDIDDSAAKEIFISLEECYEHDESGIDSLLPRIKYENLRSHLMAKGASGEFRGDARKFMEDGIKKIKVKCLEKRIREINSLMRESERKSDNNVNIDELLSEKILIDEQIRRFEGK